MPMVKPMRKISSKQLLKLLWTTEKIKAEIIWNLKTVSSGYSNTSSKDISNLFYAMFPDSKIAKDMRLGVDKVKYVINFGIAPVF